MVVDGKLKSWATAETQEVPYLFLENVRDSRSIKQWIASQEVTAEDLVEVLYQILSALAAAGEKFEYTHHDLHLENVLIRKFLELITYCTFSVPGGGCLYRGQYLAQIIDFGYSRIAQKASDRKPPRLWHKDSSSSLIDKFYPMADVYRLVGFLGE